MNSFTLYVILTQLTKKQNGIKKVVKSTKNSEIPSRPKKT